MQKEFFVKKSVFFVREHFFAKRKNIYILIGYYFYYIPTHMVLEGQQYPLYDTHSAGRENFSHQEHRESLLKKDEQQSDESDVQEHKIKEDFIQAAYEI